MLTCTHKFFPLVHIYKIFFLQISSQREKQFVYFKDEYFYGTRIPLRIKKQIRKLVLKIHWLLEGGLKFKIIIISKNIHVTTGFAKYAST